MSRILAIQIPKYLDTRAIKVVEGDATIGSALLKEEWNHIGNFQTNFFKLISNPLIL